ncbi:MAG TPA: protein-disulfide reductase DsbD domain-containing protein [Vicinamibacterales bacterium]|nr:protein-disulfide reductase DsbD domain-containing protein [Vicinamibacterales bacterium]
MRRAPGLVAALLLPAAAAAAQVHEGRTIVTARLVADTVRFRPGVPFTAGIHFAIEPGWHVYWENPGDTALPIRVSWKVGGARVSPIRWPTPHRFEEAGGVTVFGYEREAMLLAAVTPATSTAGALTLRADVEWLVCETVCLPGAAGLTLTLPRGDPDPAPDAPAIRRFAAMVPADGAKRGVAIERATARRVADRWLMTLVLQTGGGRLQAFFPRRLPGFAIEHGAIAIRGDTVELAASPEEAGGSPQRISGVAVTDRGSFDVSAKLSTGGSLSRSVSRESVPAPARVPTPAPTVSGAAAAAPTDGSAEGSGEDWLEREFAPGRAAARGSLAVLLLGALLGGLILNLMPCVLPMISVKILGFVHQAKSDAGATRLLALAFAAGVLVSFWILAVAVVVARAAGQQVGWGFQFQSPWFLLVMSSVVLVFALNLFGVFEVSGPVLGGPILRRQGPAGAFLHGTLATTLATPCTAPFLGTAIGFGLTQSVGVVLLVFTAAGLGLALPYVLLSCYPATLRWLPRPGPWLARFRQAMGFLLLAALVWLLSLFGARFGPEGVVWTLVFLLIVAFAVWLAAPAWAIGSRGPRIGAAAAALALIGMGYVWTLEVELRWRADAARDVRAADGGPIWQAFSLAELRRRVEGGETVFVNFTADWCWSCKVNERTVLQTSRVRRRMRELNVTAMKADWTERNPEITRLLAKFGRAGVPFYAVFPAGRLTEPIGLSEIITPASVVEALERAGPSRTKAST